MWSHVFLGHGVYDLNSARSTRSIRSSVVTMQPDVLSVSHQYNESQMFVMHDPVSNISFLPHFVSLILTTLEIFRDLYTIRYDRRV